MRERDGNAQSSKPFHTVKEGSNHLYRSGSKSEKTISCIIRANSIRTPRANAINSPPRFLNTWSY